MSHPYRFCTEVTPQCPVEASTYGYVPDLPSNSVLAVIFGICALGQAGLAIRCRVWGFGFAATIGCLLECLGYVGRILMHNNVWNRGPFSLQLVTLIVAPSFLAAAIYLTLKHMVRHFGAQYSRLRPVLYVWIFVCSDVACIALQAAGGGLAAGADDLDTINTGNDMIIAGLVIQVLVMVICVLLAMNFTFNVTKRKVVNRRYEAGQQAGPSLKSIRLYLSCTCLAFLTIFIRSVYRVPEFASGWGSGLMRNELDFMLLDGMMVAIAACAMTLAHPGIFFPAMSSKNRKQKLATQQDKGQGETEMV